MRRGFSLTRLLSNSPNQDKKLYITQLTATNQNKLSAKDIKFEKLTHYKLGTCMHTNQGVFVIKSEYYFTCFAV